MSVHMYLGSSAAVLTLGRPCCVCKLREVETERDGLVGKMEEYEAYIQVRLGLLMCMRQLTTLGVPRNAALTLLALILPQGVQAYEQEVRANMAAMEAERTKCAPSYSLHLHSLPSPACAGRHIMALTDGANCTGCREKQQLHRRAEADREAVAHLSGQLEASNKDRCTS